MILTEESDVTGRTPWHLTNLFTQDRQHYTTMEGGNRRICYSGIYNSIRIFYFRNKQIENLVLGLLINSEHLIPPLWATRPTHPGPF